AGSGRTDHQHVVPPRRRYKQRPLDVLLPADVREIHVVVRRLFEELRQIDHGRLQRQLTRQESDRLAERGYAVHFDAVDDRSLFRVLAWHDQPAKAMLATEQCQRERSLDWPQPPVQRKLARNQKLAGPLGSHLVIRQKQAQGDWQVKRGPFFFHVRRR